MPLVPMRLLLDHAAENDYGLAAFNVNNMEQIQAIMEAARSRPTAKRRRTSITTSR
jgi:fructose-bisphosphate aldolase, class II